MRLGTQSRNTVDETGVPVCFSTACTVGTLSMHTVCVVTHFKLHTQWSVQILLTWAGDYI